MLAGFSFSKNHLSIMSHIDKLNQLYEAGNISKVTYANLLRMLKTPAGKEKVDYLWEKNEGGTPISVVLAPNLQTPPYGQADLDALNVGREEDEQDPDTDSGTEELPEAEEDKKKAASAKEDVKRPEPLGKKSGK